MILAFGGPTDMAFIAMVAIMLFGKRLPEVARQLGKGWAELKRGISGLQSEFNSALMSDTTTSSSSSYNSSSRSSSSNLTYRDPIDDYEEQTAPKFVPPTEPS
jgi:sec-independent protein translocase protein TatA